MLISVLRYFAVRKFKQKRSAFGQRGYPYNEFVSNAYRACVYYVIIPSHVVSILKAGNDYKIYLK